MDRFKFRVWQTKRKMYLYQRNSVIDNNGDLYEMKSGLKPLNPDIHTVEQCTGLKDCEGNLIFEGDVLSFTYWWFDGNVAETQLTGIIVYDPNTMSYQLKGVKNKEWESHTGYHNDQEYLTPFSELTFDEADFKVLGNIHENPELLK